jgi:hypothetical protein
MIRKKWRQKAFPQFQYQDLQILSPKNPCQEVPNKRNLPH